jgi:small subunit ribosomal protein S6
VCRHLGRSGITPYEIMIILNADADEEQEQETIDHVDDWGRKRLAFPMDKRSDGRYVVITCLGEPAALGEIERVLSISRETVLRALFIRLNRAQAERARAGGAPAPVDTQPEGEGRPQRGGRGGGRRRTR